MIDKDEAEHMLSCFNLQDEWEARVFIDSVFEDDAIIISSPPFTTPVNLDLIAEIYKKFPFIKPYTVKMPMPDSNGNIRYVKTRRPMVIGKIYNYRLKQYAEEKNMPCWISMEEKMACGIGACLACVCQSKDVDAHSHVHNKRICKDGPVFLSTEVEL